MTAKSGPRFAIVTSTAGSVMNAVFGSSFFRSVIHSVVSDRECIAIDKARSHGVPAELHFEENTDRFCGWLSNYLVANDIDYVLSYYTKFYSEALRCQFRDKIINFHPSLLPAFKGMDGFGDTVAYHAKFIGNTVEFIADVMDEGKIIMQTACPLDLTVDVSVTRHRVFVQQCKALLQVTKWLCEDRIRVEGWKVTVKGAEFTDPHFSPALDFDEAIRLTVESAC